MSRQLQLLIDIASALRNMANNMQRVNPDYARTLLERAQAHERKALDLPAQGHA